MRETSQPPSNLAAQRVLDHHIPTAVPAGMLFASSSRGLSHCKEEDTPEGHLTQAIQAIELLADKTIRSLAATGQPAFAAASRREVPRGSS